MPSSDFPKGWPVRCPNCDSWAFVYVSDQSGNVRRYTCRTCNEMFMATWKGRKIEGLMYEPVNTKMEDWDWCRIVNRLSEGKSDGKATEIK